MSLSPPASTTVRGQPARGLLSTLFIEASPLDLRILGRTLFHAAVVGAAAGLVGAAFFVALELCERYLLEGLSGYIPLRAFGESLAPERHARPDFRPWLLLILPAIGALLSGLLTAKLAPETQGGGGDATIEAYHHHDGLVRRRVIWVKVLASALTLGSGGSGGREGPTMQIGAAIGSMVAQTLRIGARERRILLIAGVAAGISAVFRTPLGAALLATEVLYRDDFESDALIPALLASVVSYSVFISLFGEATLFAHAPRYPFVPAHLPLYVLLAVLVALLANAFVTLMRRMQAVSRRLQIPVWARPAIGGLLTGALATPIIAYFGPKVGTPGQGFGILGGGYGAAQVAISGASWLPTGWQGVEFLLLLVAVKMLASTFTIAWGGSAGDFAPSLALGGMFGGAFGRALSLLLEDPRLDPGAFALVGMGAFYGGIAHVPLSALVLVCELTGSYDLLVPLMLAIGVAFVALRKRSLYPAQVASRAESPAHRAPELAALGALRVADVMVTGRPFLSFRPSCTAQEILRRVADCGWQEVFPVQDDEGRIVGMITPVALRIIAGEREMDAWIMAADAMQPAVTVAPEDSLRAAAQAMLAHQLRELPVVDAEGRIVGFLDEAEVGRAYLDATRGPSSIHTPFPAPSGVRR